MIHRVCLVIVMCAVFASAQWVDYPTPGIPRTADGKPNLAAPVPRAADGKPDLSGLWLRVRNPNERVTVLPMGPNLEDFMRSGEKIPPLLPAAEALHQQRMANFMADRPSAHCLPHSIPDKMLIRVPLKIVQTPRLTLILYEQFTQYRQIFTDGRPHPNVGVPAWFGFSIGRWEGDWFVVDTRGFNDKSWIDDSGRPHTEALHTIERFRRRDFGHMDVEITIDDPLSYTKPWSFPLQFEFLADTEIIEDVCENEKDGAHAVGK
ncbi:MAG: hypothetical protein DMG13_25355 [Acidobacteria bacterium]|nr:MAG: hypothetical protein DMG13_25355 [Acidobacteriota bacterium]